MNTNEALSAIFAEMRDRADTVVNGRAITERNFVPQEKVEDWADRIEAAVKRKATTEKSSAVGNVAALREALEKIKKLNRYDLGCIRSRKRRDEFDAKVLEIERTVRAALSAPARNCDRFGADGAAVACRKALGLDWSRITLVRQVVGWLFSEAEGKEASNG